MRKNDYGSKRNSGGPSANSSRGDRPNNKVGRPKSARGTGAGPKSSFGERKAEGSSFGRRGSQSDRESGYRDQMRSSDWSTGGYRVTKKAPGKSSGFKGYTKDENQESRGRTFEGKAQSSRRTDPYGTKRDQSFRKDEGQGFRGQGSKELSSRRTDPYGTKRDQSFRKNEGQGFRGQGSKELSTRRTDPYGPKREAGAKDAHKGPKNGFVKKAPRLPESKRSIPKRKIEEYENETNLPEIKISDNTDREDRVEGRNSVFEAIRSGRPLNKLFVEKDSEDVLISRIIAMAREKDIPIQYLERNKLDSISQTRTHQGVILEVAAREYVEIDDILKIAEDKGEKPFVLVLDGITDTNNLGSIIRSAECAGVHGIILPKRRSATLNATVAKVAAGALEYVPVARVTNLVQTLRVLKNEGLWIIGADMEGATNYQDADLTGPCALVIGSEGEGLARLVKDECDLMVKIPMKGKISSLNAGVAAALIMFEISNQRK